MSFRQFINIVWRYRVAVAAALAGFFGILFALLYTLNSDFQATINNMVATILVGLAQIAIVIFGVSLLWRGARGNFKGGGGGKK